MASTDDTQQHTPRGALSVLSAIESWLQLCLHLPNLIWQSAPEISPEQQIYALWVGPWKESMGWAYSSYPPGLVVVRTAGLHANRTLEQTKILEQALSGLLLTGKQKCHVSLVCLV